MARVWSPDLCEIDDSDLVARVAAMTYSGRKPLEKPLLDMLGNVSKRILDSPTLRRVPHYVALAYWLRPAALARLSDSLETSEATGWLRVPRGTALHLPPANVDTISVYSWAISVLAGNANVVRLAEMLAPDTQALVTAVADVVTEHREDGRQLFCSYAYGGETERSISRHFDLRMIWGGDAKVLTVSKTPIRPDGLSIGFPDRKSIAIFGTDAYRAASESVRDSLAESFFNDVYWFDQMGCGSPRLIVWRGEPDELAVDFYSRLRRTALQRTYVVETGVAISKFAMANDLLAGGLVSRYTHFGNMLDVSRTADPATSLSYTHGGGFLYEWVVNRVQDVASIVTRSVQTITHFGLSSMEISELAHRISGRGGYRIVPVGQALMFDVIWDGVDLFEHMTRRILIRT